MGGVRGSVAAGHDDPGDSVDERLRAEQGVAQAEVGPHPFLDARDDDGAPLAPGRPCWREDGDGVLAAAARRERVSGEVLRPDVVDEGARPDARVAVDEALGRLRQRHDSVEVAVRAHARPAPGERGAAPARGQAGRVPDRPQHGLCVRARARGGLAAAREHGGDLRRTPADRCRELRGERRVAEHLDEQGVGAAPATGGELFAAQDATQTPQRYRVEPAHGREQEPDRALDVERTPVRYLDRVEERPHRRLVAQRALRPEDAHRHRRAQERALQRADLAAGTRDDGHLPPRHAVEQVPCAQRARDVRVLLRRSREQDDARRPEPLRDRASAWRGRI